MPKKKKRKKNWRSGQSLALFNVQKKASIHIGFFGGVDFSPAASIYSSIGPVREEKEEREKCLYLPYDVLWLLIKSLKLRSVFSYQIFTTVA